MKPLAAFFLLFSLLGCKSKDIDPRQQILGKWEEAYIGNDQDLTPIKNPLAYREFREYSLLIIHQYATGSEERGIYWIDSLLHMGYRRQDGMVQISSEYEYEFYDDKMRLDYASGNAIFYTTVYRRID